MGLHKHQTAGSKLGPDRLTKQARREALVTPRLFAALPSIARAIGMRSQLRQLFVQFASTADHDLTPNKFSLLLRCFRPVLSFVSSLYGFSLFVRCNFYRRGLLRKHRLPVPVVSVGNLTWGGNGKTPMTEFLARFFASAGISPLILTRGYAGGDEAVMLHRHLLKLETPAKIGVGANRVATAAHYLKRYGHVCFNSQDEYLSGEKLGKYHYGNRIGVCILDDGFQHWSLLRNLDIVMVNGMMPWGNGHLLPCGTLREPLDAIRRADIGVVHHADLVSDTELKTIVATMLSIKESLSIFFSRMCPLYLFDVQNVKSIIPPRELEDTVVLCVSAIGFPGAFSQGVRKIGALHVEQVDFVDHHFFQSDDIVLIRTLLRELECRFKTKAIAVVTEKDYYRNPTIFSELYDIRVLVMCSSLEIMSFHSHLQTSGPVHLPQLLQVQSHQNKVIASNKLWSISARMLTCANVKLLKTLIRRGPFGGLHAMPTTGEPHLLQTTHLAKEILSMLTVKLLMYS